MIINGNDNETPETNIVKFRKKPEASPSENEFINITDTTDTIRNSLEELLIDQNVLTPMDSDDKIEDASIMFSLVCSLIYSFMLKHAEHDMSQSSHISLFDSMAGLYKIGYEHATFDMMDDIV